MAEAAETMVGGISGSLEDFKNKIVETKDVLGEFASWFYQRKNFEPYGPLIGHLWGEPKPPVPLNPERDNSGEPIPGKFKPIRGNAFDIPGMDAILRQGSSRPLIPSEPGSSTERTAREQLEAIRRLERIHMWGGGAGGVGGSSGAAPGGGSPGGGGGRGRSPRAAPSARRAAFGHPGKGGGGGTPDGPPEPAGKGGYRGGATPHNLGVFMKAAEDQLRQEGVPEANVHAAASVLAGNAIQESKLNPKAIHDQGTGYGIYGARLGRRTKMLAWLSQHGYAKDSLEGQARYMAHDAITNYPKTKRALMGATGGNLGSATSTTMTEFEAPKRGPGAGEGNRRGAASSAFHDQHSQLEDLRRKAEEPVRVKIAYDFDAADVPHA